MPGPERRGAASLQHRRMAQMLDTLDYGMLLIGENLDVSHINKAARRDMDDHHPLQWVGGQLQAPCRRTSSRCVMPWWAPPSAACAACCSLGDSQGPGRQRISVAVVPLPLGNRVKTCMR
jgi:hypothetical protein